MNLARAFKTSVLAILVAATAMVARAGGVSTISISAMRPVLLADGKHTTDITARVRDSSGRQITSNVLVQFTTTAGQLSATQAYTDFSGVARVRLTSAPVSGIAKVQAFAAGATPDTIEVEFTDDPDATYLGNSYMGFTAKTYLAYSATDRVIEGEGINGGAKVTYRNFEVTGDRLQYRCDDGILRAQGVVSIKRGSHHLDASRLYYNLMNGEGWAVTREKDGTAKSVRLYGEALREEESKTPPPYSYMAMPALQVKLIISAVSINYFPNDKLQFRKPKFFQDQAQIMTMAYYELPLHSDQLFTDQFFSVGTRGFGLELPIYYNLTATNSGVLTIRHQQQVGEGYFSTEPGWAIDVNQGYNSNGEHRFEGVYGFNGLTRRDWDFRWNHSQEFSSNTQGSFDLEFPNHNSIYGGTNFTQQFSKFRWGANVAAGRTFLTDQTLSTRADVYFESQPKALAGIQNLLYTVGTTLLSAHSESRNTAIPAASETREGVNLHAFTRPMQIDKNTSFNSSFTIGHTWAGHEGSGATALATLALDHRFNKAGNVNLTYDLVMQPGTFYDTGGKHRLSASYNFNQSKRFGMSVFGSMYLDSTNNSLIADASYRFDKLWRLVGAATLQKFNDLSYTDFEMRLGRRLGARELQVAYSTYLKRVSVDYTATRF